MKRPHTVILPFPSQGHIGPMLQLAKLLHFDGSFITYINTESSYQSILRSEGPDALNGLEDFRFETIPDGLESNSPNQQHVVKGILTTHENCAEPLRDLLKRLNESSNMPNITSIIPNGFMSFALDVAEELKIPAFVFWTTSACGFMATFQLGQLIQRGYTPLKDESYLTNGYLDTPIDWIPGLKDIRLRDLPSYIRTLDEDDFFLNTDKDAAKKTLKAQGLIFNTFDLLETEVLTALKPMFPNLYTIGPLFSLVKHTQQGPTNSIHLNPWKEDHGYMEWLNDQRRGSVVYVNFGSIGTTTSHQLIEFAWGLANSSHPFLWVIRPDLMDKDCTLFFEDFIKRTKERGYIASWCSQVEVLYHTSVGGFLSHCGWNSTLESICGGVPIICWPGFAEQYTNTRYVCNEWKCGIEIDREVRREQVCTVVRELMEGEKGKEARKTVLKWKARSEEAISPSGSSYQNLEKLVKDLNLGKEGL